MQENKIVFRLMPNLHIFQKYTLQQMAIHNIALNVVIFIYKRQNFFFYVHTSTKFFLLVINHTIDFGKINYWTYQSTYSIVVGWLVGYQTN